MKEPNLQRKETVLEEAIRLVEGARGGDYGPPLDDFGRTAQLANVLLARKLKEPLKAEDIPLIMICVKLSREANRPKRDNLVDLCGYAQTLDMVYRERMRREEGL